MRPRPTTAARTGRSRGTEVIEGRYRARVRLRPPGPAPGSAAAEDGGLHAVPESDRRPAHRVVTGLAARRHLLDAGLHPRAECVGLDHLDVGRRGVADVEEVALPAPPEVAGVAEPAAAEPGDLVVAAVLAGRVGDLLPEPEDLALGIVDQDAHVGIGPPAEALHLQPHRQLAYLVPPDGHELVVGPDVPAVGGVLGVHVGEWQPVELGLAPVVEVQPTLHHLFELTAWVRRHGATPRCGSGGSDGSGVHGPRGAFSRPRWTGRGWGRSGRPRRSRLAAPRAGVDPGRPPCGPSPARTPRVPRTRRRRGPGTGQDRRRCASGPGLRVGALPPAVADGARLLELDDHLGQIGHVVLGRLGELELPLLEEHREDRLQLHQGERLTHTTVASGPERDPRPRVEAVLLARLDVAGRVEAA